MDFDWKQIFLNDLDWNFAAEIAFRTVLMFVLILLFLRFSGKKGVRQLSIFEVAVIIALGSAAGDPMFNDDFAILPSLVVFAAILSFYRIVTYFAGKFQFVEFWLEGKPMYIIEEGVFVLQERTDHNFAKDEFFSEMRYEGIEHLGQVRVAILETNGKVSFFYFEDSDVRYGLPVLPKEFEKRSEEIAHEAYYSCTYCGHTQILKTASKCRRCGNKEWAESVNSLRVQ